MERVCVIGILVFVGGLLILAGLRAMGVWI
jgi:hypothetical protein